MDYGTCSREGTNTHSIRMKIGNAINTGASAEVIKANKAMPEICSLLPIGNLKV